MCNNSVLNVGVQGPFLAHLLATPSTLMLDINRRKNVGFLKCKPRPRGG